MSTVNDYSPSTNSPHQTSERPISVNMVPDRNNTQDENDFGDWNQSSAAYDNFNERRREGFFGAHLSERYCFTNPPSGNSISGSAVPDNNNNQHEDEIGSWTQSSASDDSEDQAVSPISPLALLKSRPFSEIATPNAEEPANRDEAFLEAFETYVGPYQNPFDIYGNESEEIEESSDGYADENSSATGRLLLLKGYMQFELRLRM